MKKTEEQFLVKDTKSYPKVPISAPGYLFSVSQMVIVDANKIRKAMMNPIILFLSFEKSG